MDDLEATRLCAEAMGLPALDDGGSYYDGEGSSRNYWPLAECNDAQAMALVKQMNLSIAEPRGGGGWGAYRHNALREHTAEYSDLNRAIVYCVAKMQKAKEPA